MHPNSILLFKKYTTTIFKSNMRILEIGPSEIPTPFRKLVKKRNIIWETLDISPIPHLTYKAKSEYEFPIPDNTFDIVISANVLEHVRKIWVWMKEASRVCKKGGHVITIVPVSWPYHLAPKDCWRIYPDGMRALYEVAGLHVDLCTFESLEKVGHRNVFPGTTDGSFNQRTGQQWKKPIVKSFIKDIFGYPISAAFDTIAIGTKIK